MNFFRIFYLSTDEIVQHILLVITKEGHYIDEVLVVVDLMVEEEVLEELGLVPIPVSHCCSAEEAGHCVWFTDHVQ